MKVVISRPVKAGKSAVTAVASPSIRSEMIPSTCSRINRITKITPMAMKPGISRTEWSQPMSEPSNCATSMTKLFKSADHVEKASGIAMAIRISSAIGWRQMGSDLASSRDIDLSFI